jgi:hypothetical protein
MVVGRSPGIDLWGLVQVASEEAKIVGVVECKHISMVSYGKHV